MSSSLDCAAVDVCCGDPMNGREAVTGATLADAIRDAATDATSASLLELVTITITSWLGSKNLPKNSIIFSDCEEVIIL